LRGTGIKNVSVLRLAESQACDTAHRNVTGKLAGNLAAGHGGSSTSSRRCPTCQIDTQTQHLYI
jgi:hypothetical protein